ncbi:hypothetical protein Bsph_3769 [Lysinibacillus sphaericus C3-41]|uniref:Uncharacterized protein n=1 Tax=Lysinibacillus sphaericus (strain C3-41) TaxID=444177 RepID=B1HTP5_LYSSC|nr:hypothetical protein Bsph_3769 [Lysinibacillus sphaericus C3-41]
MSIPPYICIVTVLIHVLHTNILAQLKLESLPIVCQNPAMFVTSNILS